MEDENFIEADSYITNYIRSINNQLTEVYKYDDGFTVLKELIQNANDASSEEVRVYLFSGIPNARHPLLRRRAILVYDDGDFTPENEEAIIEIGTDNKLHDPTKIGKYGLGMKSIFHICDMFFYVINGQKVKALNPWGKDKENRHEDWKRVYKSDMDLVLDSIPTELKNKKGFILWIPEKEENEEHIVTNEKKIDIEFPFAKDENSLLEKLNVVLSLLSQVSNSPKKLKKISYKTPKREFSVSVEEKKGKLCVVDSTNNIPTPFSVYHSKEYFNFDKNELFNSLVEKKVFTKEALEKVKSSIEIIKTPKKGSSAFLTINYCVFLPLPEPKNLQVKIDSDFDILVLIHCNFTVDSGRNGIVDYEKLTQKLTENDYEEIKNPPSANYFSHVRWNRLLAQDLVYPSVPAALFESIQKEILTDKELELVIKGLYNINRKQTSDEPKIINEFVFRKNALVKNYNKNFEISWNLIDLSQEENAVFLPICKEEDEINKVFERISNNNIVYIAADSDFHYLWPDNSENDNSAEAIIQLIQQMKPRVLEEKELTDIVIRFIRLNSSAICKNPQITAVFFRKIRELLQNAVFSKIIANSNLHELFVKMNGLGTTNDNPTDYRVFSAGAKKSDSKSYITETQWKAIWEIDSNFILVPGVFDLSEKPTDQLFYKDSINSICAFCQNHVDKSIQSIIINDLMPILVSFQDVLTQYPNLYICQLDELKTGEKNFYSFSELKNYAYNSKLFKAENSKNQLLKDYANLLVNDSIYSITNKYYSNASLSDYILEGTANDIAKSFTEAQFFNSEINKDKAVQNQFIHSFFKDNVKYDSRFRAFYRFILSGFNPDSHLKDIYTLDSNNKKNLWYKIFKKCEPKAIYIPDEYKNCSDFVSDNQDALGITELDDDACYEKFFEYAQEKYNNHENQILAFLKAEEFRTPENQKKITERVCANKQNAWLYYLLPFQKDYKTGEYLDSVDYDTCILNINNTYEFPKGFESRIRFIKPSSDEILLARQKDFLQTFDKQKYVRIVLFNLKGNDYSNWIIENIANLKSEDFFLSIETIPWIPVKKTSTFCSLSDLIIENMFNSQISLILCSYYSFYKLEDLAISQENKEKLSKVLNKDFKHFAEILSNKINKAEKYYFYLQEEQEFSKLLLLFKNSELLPYLHLLGLMQDDKNLCKYISPYFDIYRKLHITKDMSIILGLITEIQKKKKDTYSVSIFNSLLEEHLRNTSDFSLDSIKYPVAGNEWKEASNIVNSDSNGIDKNNRLEPVTYKLLKEEFKILPDVDNVGHVQGLSARKILNNNSSEQEIIDFSNSWTDLMQEPKLLYLLLFLLKGKFQEYALKQYGREEFKYVIDIFKYTIEPEKNFWCYGMENKEIFMNSKLYESQIIIQIPKDDTVFMESLTGTTIGVKQDKTGTPIEYRPSLLHPGKPFIINLLSIKGRTNKDLDKYVRELIHHVFVNCYFHFNAENVDSIISGFLKSDQNKIDETANYIQRILFEKLYNLKLNDEAFKQLYDKNFDLDSLTNKLSLAEKDKAARELNQELISYLKTPDFQTKVLKAVVVEITHQKYKSTSVLFELFQNADDCVNDLLTVYSSDKLPPEIFKFVIAYDEEKNCLFVSHFGRKINQNINNPNTDKYKYDLRNMLFFNASSKDEELGDSGKFGLGFKSVYTICDKPIVTSGDIGFEIIAGIYPVSKNVSSSHRQYNKNETCYELHLKEGISVEENVFAEFKKNINLIPIFAKQINQIDFCNSSYNLELIESIYSAENTDEKIVKYKINADEFLVIEGNSFKVVFSISDDEIVDLSDDICRVWNLTPLIHSKVKKLPFAIDAPFQVNTGRTIADFDESDMNMLLEIGKEFGCLVSKLIDCNYFSQITNLLVGIANQDDKTFKPFSLNALEMIHSITNYISTGYGTVEKYDTTETPAIRILPVSLSRYYINDPFITLSKAKNFIDTFNYNGIIVTSTASRCYEEIGITSFNSFKLEELLDCISTSYIDNDILSRFIDVFENLQYSDFEINFSKYYLLNTNNTPVKANELIIPDGKAEIDEDLLLSPSYSSKCISFLEQFDCFKNNRYNFVLDNLIDIKAKYEYPEHISDDIDLPEPPVQDEIPSFAIQSFNWKKEYFRLIRDIRSFMKETRPIIRSDELYGEICELNDIQNFGEEKRIWNLLKEKQNKIINSDSIESPDDYSNWRQFLSAKYKGHCQLCGMRTAVSYQDSYFWTFRIVKESDNRLANIKSNLFCLCPACHGKMRYGNLLGKDLSKVVEAAEIYGNFIEEQLSNQDNSSEMPPLISELVDENNDIEGFHKPIAFNVKINGKDDYKMVFSWEHFMRIAFIFSHLNDYDESELIESENDEIDNYGNGNYHQWHGTEYVTGHYRTRNGQTEWVRGHWRTR